MISSTAAAPGAKAGTSKEVHELKRKVLERSNSGLSVTSIPQPHRMTDIAGTLRKPNPPATREAKRKAQEKLGLGQINEEGTQSDEEDSQQRMAVAKAPRKKVAEKRDPKPGYCENCRDKFDDFEEVSYMSCYGCVDRILSVISMSCLANTASSLSLPPIGPNSMRSCLNWFDHGTTMSLILTNTETPSF